VHVHSGDIILILSLKLFTEEQNLG